MASLPPGRSTRTASSIALARPATSLMLWMAMLWMARLEDDDVESAVVERQVGHVCGTQFDAIGHALAVRIAQRGLLGVAGLVHAAPQVNADRTAGVQALGGPQQYRAPPAAEVQRSLAATRADLVK